MNKIFFTLTIIFIFFLSCKRDSTSILDKTTISQLIEKNKSDSILGKYYVKVFDKIDKNSLRLLKKKPENLSNVFEFDFLTTGKINIENLTDIYECGEQEILITAAEWQNINRNQYLLHFRGTFKSIPTPGTKSKVQMFETVAQYSFENDLNTKYLRLEKIINTKFE